MANQEKRARASKPRRTVSTIYHVCMSMCVSVCLLSVHSIPVGMWQLQIRPVAVSCDRSCELMRFQWVSGDSAAHVHVWVACVESAGLMRLHPHRNSSSCSLHVSRCGCLLCSASPSHTRWCGCSECFALTAYMVVRADCVQYLLSIAARAYVVCAAVPVRLGNLGFRINKVQLKGATS